MTMFTIYYDASGTEGSGGFLAVAGLVSTNRKWSRFERDWDAVLMRNGVQRFHMRKFTTPHGEFAGWSEERRRDFLHDLVSTIKRRVHKVHVGLIEANAFTDLKGVYDFGVMPVRGAYQAVAAFTMMRAEDWLNEKHGVRRIVHVHEKGDTYQGDLHSKETAQSIRGDIEFIPKVRDGQYVRQFEAADLIAWEFRRGYLDIKARKEGRLTRLPRKSLHRIFTTIPCDPIELPRSMLIEFCDQSFPRK